MGQTLKLHSRDENVVLSIDPQLDRYKEISDIVFRKRPDLSDVGDNASMSRELLSNIAAVGAGLAMIGMSFVFIFYVSRDGIIFATVPFSIGMFFIVQWLLLPQSILLENQKMIVAYLFRKVSYTAGDIKSITLVKKATRSGYIYFIQVNLNTDKSLKLVGFKPGSVLTYQILKRWHNKANSIPLNRS